MIPIPNLPTDNLYKLLAIFGLIGVILPPYLLTTEVNKLSMQVFEAKKQVEFFDAEAVFLKEDRLTISEKMDDINDVLSLYKKSSFKEDSIDLSAMLYNLQTDKNLRDYYKFKYEYFNKYHLPFKLNNELDELFELYNANDRELTLLNIEIVSNLDIVGDRIEKIEKYKYAIWITLICSSLLFLCGLLLWYLQVQRHLDKKIAAYSLENNDLGS